MSMSPAGFEGLRLESFEPCACSPELDDFSVGLQIAAPQSILLAAKPSWPLCGTYRMAASFVNRFRVAAAEIVVVVVDRSTHVPHATNLLPKGMAPAGQHFDETTEGWESTTMGGWFNIDLFGRIDTLPRQPAAYWVYAFIGELVSNVCTVELSKP